MGKGAIMIKQCILCKTSHLEMTSHIKAKNLIAFYRKSFGIDITHLIPTDLRYYHCKNCDLRFFTLEDGKIPTGDNEFYNALNQFDWYYFSEKSEYHYAKSFITPESKVLEVGCGKGAFAKFLPTQAKANYIGLEFSTKAKEMAALDGVRIENIAIEEYAKTHAHTFDVATSFQVLEHVANPYEFLRAQIECLKKPNNTHISMGGGRKTQSLRIMQAS